MFGFLGKGKKKEQESPAPVAADPVDVGELLAQAAELEAVLPEKAGGERIEILNKLGGIYFKAQEYDKAIERYETSLSEDPKLGIAHKDLMKLYSVKKKQAAAAKDNDQVMYYMNKMEELTAISKKSMRSGNF